jgi:hypothetical protein
MKQIHRRVRAGCRVPLQHQAPMVEPAVEPVVCVPQLMWDFDELVKGSHRESTIPRPHGDT